GGSARPRAAPGAPPPARYSNAPRPTRGLGFRPPGPIPPQHPEEPWPRSCPGASAPSWRPTTGPSWPPSTTAAGPTPCPCCAPWSTGSCGVRTRYLAAHPFASLTVLGEGFGGEG